jgi:prepilin-type N-terminal cleavage/methylation domain-containing protein
MRARGFTLVELLMALLLLALALSGLVMLWSFGFNTTAHSRDIGVAYSVARQEIESARGLGYMLLPEGSWTVSYDGEGHPTTEANPRFTAVCTGATIPLPTGEIDSRCLRALTVQVLARGRPEPVFETTTYFTRGGV